jgi:hypothetical protein
MEHIGVPRFAGTLAKRGFLGKWSAACVGVVSVPRSVPSRENDAL